MKIRRDFSWRLFKGWYCGQANKIIWKYIDSLERTVLIPKKADESKGSNHCVYEDRIFTEMEDGVTLAGLLEGKNSSAGKSLIIISAPSDGYARKFFAVRLMIVGTDSLKRQISPGKSFKNMNRKGADWPRIPIVINTEINTDDFQEEQRESDLDFWARICETSIKKQLEKNEKFVYNTRKTKYVKRFMHIKLENGQVILLLPWGCLDKVTGLYSKVVSGLRKERCDYGNIVICVGEEDNIFFDAEYGYLIKLDSLTEDEILEHIRYITINDMETVDYFRKLLQDNVMFKKELQIPERLLFLSKLFLKNTSQNMAEQRNVLRGLSSAAQLYKIIIRESIERCLRECLGHEAARRTIEVIYNALRELAWLDVLGDLDIRELVEKTNKNFLETLKKTTKNKLGKNFEIWETLINNSEFFVDSDNRFLFIGCQHYLIADKLLGFLREDKEVIKRYLCKSVFVKKNNNQIYYFLADMLKEGTNEENVREYFGVIWDCIIDDRIAGENNRVEILLKAMEHVGLKDDYIFIQKFLSFIAKELSSKYYDSHVFDTLHEINLRNPQLGINNYLLDYYATLQKSGEKTEESVDNQKRRLAYYFGKEKCDINKALIEDLINPNVHTHVKYHIMPAIIECYNIKTAKLWKEYKDKIIACEENWREDSILYSDYLLLQEKMNNMEFRGGENKNSLQRRLFGELKAEDYWKRAHAAGALGRLGLLASVDELMQQLGVEIERIETERDSLKVVCYIVEAICELFYRQNKDIMRENEHDRRERYDERLKDCKESFVEKMVFPSYPEETYENIDILIWFLTASATMALGIVYLDSQVVDRMPENIGRYIKDIEVDVEEKRNIILKSFAIVERKYGYGDDDVKRKKEEMRDLCERILRKGEEKWDKSKNFTNGQVDYDHQGLFICDKVQNQINNIFLCDHRSSGVEKEKNNMIIVNNGPVENQQNIEREGTGYLYAAESKDVSESKEVKEIRKIIEENCPQDMQDKLLSIISELIESIKENGQESKNVSTWTNKLYMAVTGMGSMASILDASWWPTLIESIKNLLQSL